MAKVAEKVKFLWSKIVIKFSSSLKDIVFLIVALEIFFGIFLGSRPLSVPDEGRYTEIPREMVASGDYLTPHLNGVHYFEKPPLMYWLTSMSIKLFGVNEWALRLWPAFLAIFGCLITYHFASQFYGRSTGITSSIILASNLLYYGHSRFLILDLCFSVCLTAALFSFFLGQKETQKQQFYLYSFFVFAALATLSKGLIGIVLPGMIILLWAGVERRWSALKFAFHPLGVLLFLIIVLPWHVMISLKNPGFFDFYFVREHFLRYLTPMHRREQPFWFFLLVIAVGLFPWVSFVLQSIWAAWKRVQEKTGLESFLLVWIVSIFAFFSMSNSKLIPYILPIFPPLCILIGWFIARLWDSNGYVYKNRKEVRPFIDFSAICITMIPIIIFVITRWSKWEPETINIGVLIIITILLVGASMVFVLQRLGLFRAAIVSVAVTGSLIMIFGNLVASEIEGRSIKSLVMTLKERIKGDDIVVSYNRYYQDLPAYLERPVQVVGYLGELEFGASQPGGDRWMIKEPKFAELLKQDKRMYIVTSKNFVPELVKHYSLNNLQTIAQTDNDILIVRE